MPYITAVYLITLVSGLTLSLWRHPFWGLLTYLIVYIVSPSNHWWGEIFYGKNIQPIIVAIIAISIIIHFNKVNIKILLNKYNLILLAFTLNMFLTNLLFSIDSSVSFQYFDKFIKIIIVYLSIQICFHDLKNIRYFLQIFIICFIYLSIDSIKYFHGSRLDNYGLTDANDANTIAVVAVMALIIMLIRLDFKKYKLESTFFLISTLPVINFIAMTRSRGAFIGIVISCFWFLVSDKRVKKGYILIFITLFLSLFFFISDKSYIDRISFSINYSKNNFDLSNATAGRFGIWTYVPNLIKIYPFGIGSGNFYYLSSSVLPEELLGEGGKKVLHNTYLQALLELNIVGLILYIFFLGAIIFDLRKYRTFLLKNEVSSCMSALLIGYSSIFEVLLVSYGVMSFFLDRLYFEFFYLIASLSVIVIHNMKISIDNNKNIND